VGLYSADMCSAGEAGALQAKFAERMKTIEGGPLELKQTVETINLCAAQVRARKGLPLQVAGKVVQPAADQAGGI
jgi:alanyl aminopeptidase